MGGQEGARSVGGGGKWEEEGGEAGGFAGAVIRNRTQGELARTESDLTNPLPREKRCLLQSLAANDLREIPLSLPLNHKPETLTMLPPGRRGGV